MLHNFNCLECGVLFSSTKIQRKFCCHSHAISYKNRKTIDELFWSHVEKTESCWYWTGFITEKGYGMGYLNGRSYHAHRISYEIHKGPIPIDCEIHHTCKPPQGVPLESPPLHRRCVRPDHLEAITHAQNLTIDLTKTHCIRGHALTEDSVYRMRDGGRTCKKCESIRSKAKYYKNRKKILARQSAYYRRQKALRAS